MWRDIKHVSSLTFACILSRNISVKESRFQNPDFLWKNTLTIPVLFINNCGKCRENSLVCLRHRLTFCDFFFSFAFFPPLQYPFLFGLCVALSWSVLVCVSRVYMGMHSILVGSKVHFHQQRLSAITDSCII